MNTISVRGVPVDQVSQVKLGVKEVDRHLHVLGGQVHVQFTFKEDIQSKGTLTFQLPPLFAKSQLWPLKLGLSISLLFFGQSSVSRKARDTLLLKK